MFENQKSFLGGGKITYWERALFGRYAPNCVEKYFSKSGKILLKKLPPSSHLPRTVPLSTSYQPPINPLSSPTMVGVGSVLGRSWYGVDTVLILSMSVLCVFWCYNYTDNLIVKCDFKDFFKKIWPCRAVFVILQFI